MPATTNRAFTLIELMLAIVVIVVLIVMMLPNCSTDGGPSPIPQCASNVRGAAQALNNYPCRTATA
jgi:prepilin-type N-terminal cleavage/methylation domain-containing protein